MDFLTPSCPICCLYVSDVMGHWRWHEATDGSVIPADKADDFAAVRQAYKEYAEHWAELDRRRAERKAAQGG